MRDSAKGGPERVPLQIVEIDQCSSIMLGTSFSILTQICHVQAILCLLHEACEGLTPCHAPRRSQEI